VTSFLRGLGISAQSRSISARGSNTTCVDPARVFTRKTANMPDYRTPPTQRPAPFDFAFLLDVPFVHLGMNDLLYEIVMHGSSSSSSIFCDSPVYLSAPTISWGSFTSAGGGCATSNGRFLARSQISQTFASGLVDFRFDCSGGPASANGAVLMGFAPLNVPIPGLCTNLYTDGSIGNLPLTTTGAGGGSTGQLPLPWNPAWLNLVITAQAAALDASQQRIPVAATQGLRCSIAPPSLPVATGARLWSQNNTTAVTGTSSTNGWLVTQFRH
jgi:hypothetical protein